MFKELVDKVGLDQSEFGEWLKKGEGFLLHQLRRKVRYHCYEMKRGKRDNVPQNLITYYESAHGFQGWEHFADVWDVEKDDPSVVYQRDFTVLEEWDATLRRVVPELPGLIRVK